MKQYGQCFVMSISYVTPGYHLWQYWRKTPHGVNDGLWIPLDGGRDGDPPHAIYAFALLIIYSINRG
jgi:hypothetical protein